MEREGARASRGGGRVRDGQTEFATAAAVTLHHLALRRAFIRTCQSPVDILPVGFTNVAMVTEEDTAGSQCHEYVPDGKRRTQVGRSF